MRITFALFIFLPLQSFAFDFNVYGGFTFAAPTERVQGTNQKWTGDAGTSYGASLGFGIFESPFALEIGAFSIQAVSRQDSGGTTAVRTFKSIEIPVLLRLKFDQAFSLGVGPYFASLIQLSGANGQFENQDRGLLLSLQAKMHLFSSVFLLFDGRYQHGLANLANQSGDLLNTRSVQGFSGLSLSL